MPYVDLGSYTVASIATGHSHACAVFENGRLKCWGWNAAGQLGYGDTDNRGDGPGEMGSNLTFVAESGRQAERSC